MNLIERTIAAVSPQRALRRELARVQLDQVRRAGGASRSRRGDSWYRNTLETRRQELRDNRPLNRYDRDRLRHVFDTHPFAVKTKGSLLNNLIGYGITGTLKGPRAARELWANWVKVCDYDGVYDLYGLQALIAETWLDDGEVFIVTRLVPGAAFHPLRLQVLDVDQLDTTAAVANARVRDGIEYADGKPVAYHFRRSKELSEYADPVVVPADQVIHLFWRKRPGQWRGRPHFESVLDVMTDVDDYLEAEGVRKKISACFVGFRAPSIDGDDPAMGEVDQDSATDGEAPEESFFPGMIINGRPGETMTFGDPKADGGIGDFMRWAGLRMAAGSQTTYERSTGDLSNVNYTSYKAGDLEFQRFVGRVQWLLLIPRLCHRIEAAWLDVGYATGLIGRQRPTFKWTPPAFGSVDLGKEVKAKREQMAGGFESLRNVAAEFGYDLDELSDEIIADIAMIVKKLEDKGLQSMAPALIASMLGIKQNSGGSNAAPDTADA